MKLIKNAIWILVIITMISCNKKTAKDIDVSKIKTPCEWLDAYEIAFKECNSFLEKEVDQLKKDDKELTEEEVEKLQEKFKFYSDLINELWVLHDDEDWNDEIKECKKADKRLEELEKIAKKNAKLIEKLGRYINWPTENAIEYLNALKNKDWDKAKTLATRETAQNLDMMKSLGTNFDLTEVKDVLCKVDGDKATCTFCCTKDTSFKELKMVKEGDKWLAHQPKETPPPTDATAVDSLSIEMDRVINEGN